MAIKKTPVFDDLEAAKTYAAEQTATNPRARTVYRLEFLGRDGISVVKFLVAQSVSRAQVHAYAQLRDALPVTLGVAERKPSRPKTPEEFMRTLSSEEIDRVKAVLAEMTPDKPRRKKGE